MTVWRRGETLQRTQGDDADDLVLKTISENPNCTFRDLKQWIKLPEYKIRAASARLEGGAKITIDVFGAITRYNLY